MGEIAVPSQDKYRSGDDDGFARSGIDFSVSLSGPQEVCSGQTIKLVATVKGVDEYDYVWTRGENTAILSKESSLELKSIKIGEAGIYNCKVSDKRGLVSEIQSLEIKVYATPEITLSTDKARIASGDSVHLTTTTVNAQSYVWSTGENTSSIWCKPRTTTTYSVIAINEGICKSSASIEIEVIDLFVRSEGDKYISKDNSAILVVETNADIIKWYAKPLESGSMKKGRSMLASPETLYGEYVGEGKTLTVSPLVTTVYTAVATFNSYAVVSRMTVNVKNADAYNGGDDDGFSRTSINFGVTVNVSPNPVCENSEAVFTATAKGVGIYTYKWKKVGEAGVREDTCVYVIAKTKLEDIGKYYCEVSDGKISIYSDTLDFKVNDLPVASIVRPAVKDTILCSGDTLMLMGNSSYADAVLTWSGNNLIPGPSDNIVHIAPMVESKYVLTATNQGCSTIDTIHVRINKPYVDIPAVINTTENSEVKISALDRDGIEIMVYGTEMSWFKDGGKIFTGNPLPIKPKTDMEVVVKYTNGGCVATDKTRLLIKGAGSFRGGNDDGFSATCLPPVILEQHGVKREQCVAMDSTELVVVAEGSNIHYEWQKLDSYSETYITFVPPVGSVVEGMSSGTLKFKKITDKINGDYRCVLTNGCSDGEVVSDTFHVSMKGEPIILSGINIERDQCVESGATVTWNIVAENSAGIGNLSYRWFKDGRQLTLENSDTLNPYYQFNITSADGREQGLYVVQVKNECGIASDSAFLPVLFQPKAKECSREVFACKGGEAEFTVKSEHVGNYTYTLYKYDIKTGKFGDVVGTGSNKITLHNLQTSGNYRWIISHPYCSPETGLLENMPGKSDIMYLIIEEPPYFTLQPITDTVICAGKTIEFTCKAETASYDPEHTRPVKYNWYWEGVLINAVPYTNGTLTLSNVRGEDAGTYYCKAFNSCAPVKSNSVVLKVTDRPQFASGPTVAPEYCEGDKILLAATLKDRYPADSVRWYFGSQPLRDIPGRMSGTGSLQMTIDSVIPSDENGNFYIRAYNRCEYSDGNWANFKVRRPARFVRDLTDGSVTALMCPGENQTLTVEATGTAPLRFTWLMNGDTIVDSYSNQLNIDATKVDVKGKFTCHVQNTCGDDITETQIEVSRPDTFPLVGGGHYCTMDEGITIHLAGSDTNAVYRLYSKGQRTPLKVIDGNTVAPPFGDIVFDGLRNGTYYVTASDTSFVTMSGLNTCESKMPGEAVITEYPLPEIYDLIITRHLCQGEIDGDLQLKGSQRGIVYRLCVKNIWKWDTVGYYAGTGQAIDMKNMSIGDYKIVAVNPQTGCRINLPVIASLIEQPLPVAGDLYFKNNDSTYCTNIRSDVVLKYDPFESGNTYQLIRNKMSFGQMVNTNNLNWTNVEEGRYSVKVTNMWGCSVTFGDRKVITQKPPTRYQVIGTHYFCPYDTKGCFVELDNSEPGINYSFRYLTNNLYKDTLSRGAAIRMDIPLTERSYYVIATDTTPEHCTIPMRDTLHVVMSRMKLNVTSPVTVNYNDVVRLNLSASGYLGTENDLRIQWDNMWLAEGVDTKTPLTKKLTESHDIPVKVWDLNCMAEASVRVNCIGGDLKADIKTSTCSTVMGDTIRICGDEPLAFCGMASGGATGNYVYRWWDKEQSRGNGERLTPYAKRSDGYLWLEVTDNKEKIRDSIWVVVNEAPRVDTLLDRGLVCVAPGGSITVKLKNTQTQTHYQLEYKTDGGEWVEVAHMNQAGTGRDIDFLIHDGLSALGHLRVMASIPMKEGIGFCKKVMKGDVEVRQAPLKFNVHGGWAYCAGEVKSGTITLDSSENSAVAYRLYPTPQSGITQLTGINDTLKFTGNYKAANYKIVAQRGVCIDTMYGKAIVKENKLPDMDTLIGAGDYCVHKGAVLTGITNGEVNKEYTLTLDSLRGGTSTTTWYGEGKISFGTVSAAGTYTVSGVDTVTGCKATLDQTLVIHPSPERYNVTGGWEYCEGLVKSGTILLDSSENSAVTYRLLPAPEAGIKELTGINDTLKFTGNYTADEYKIVAQLGNCIDTMWGSALIQENKLPDYDTLIGAGEYCTDQGDVAIGITKGLPDVEYTLVLDTLHKGTSKTLFYGEGRLLFGDYNIAGTYKVEARDTLTGCILTTSQKVVIGNTPANLHVEGGGHICSGQSATQVKLKIYPVEAGVTYALVKVPGVNMGQFGSKDVDSLYYSGALGIGQYVVKAQIGDCSRVYTDTVKVEAGGQVDQPEMTRPIMVCEGMTLDIGLAPAAIGIKYSLYKKGNSIPLVESIGDGNSLTFPGQTAIGSYQVVATHLISGCHRDLYPEYTIGKYPERFAIIGGTEYCEGLGGVKIGITGTEAGVMYQLQKENNLSGAWENVTQLVGTGSSADFAGIFPEGLYRIVAGNACTEVMNGELDVKAIAYPDGSITLQRAGNACVDSAIVISIPRSEATMTYTLYCDGLAVLGTDYTGGGYLEWKVRPDRPAVYVIKTTIKGCEVTLKGSVNVGKTPSLPDLAGDVTYCENLSAQLYLKPYSPGAKYELYSSPDNVLVKQGTENIDKLFFTGLKKGTYYTKASEGDCSFTGKPIVINSVSAPALVAWELNDCVNSDAGEILVKGLVSDNEYTVTYDYGKTYRQRKYAGDWTVGSNLPVGGYQLLVKDTLHGCLSAVVRDTIREGVYDMDTIVGDLNYCAYEGGSMLKVSTVRTNISYMLKTLSGAIVGDIRYPQNSFGRVGEGTYVFEKKRLGSLGGCFTAESFVVKKQPSPAVNKEVVLLGDSKYCAGGTYQVQVKQTEAKMRYILKKTSPTQPIDTFYGDGTTKVFAKSISEAGTYRVYVSDTVRFCEEYLQQSVKINSLPVKISVENCAVCYSTGDPLDKAKCSISLSGMLSGTLYRLNNGLEIDTLKGIGRAFYKPQIRGDYKIIAEDILTGCTDTMPAQVKGMLAPKVLAVTSTCKPLPEQVSVKMDMTEGDTVTYSLYKDGRLTAMPPVKGIGGAISFNNISEAGVYKVWASKLSNGCGVFMTDSVVLYTPMADCDTLIVQGTFCEGTTGAGATLTYPCSVSGWKYYITNDLTNSDTLDGNGRMRSWSQFNNMPITGGVFKLYAISPCGGTDQYIAQATVVGRPAPILYPLKNSNISLCSGSSFVFELSNSDVGVNYIVKRFNSSTNVLEKEFKVTSPVNGPLVLGSFSATGVYEIWANNGCPAGPIVIPVGNGVRPDLQEVIGPDVCIQNGVNSIQITMQNRQDKVNYYLYADNNKVDQLTDADPLKMAFTPQTQPAAYTVVAVHPTGNCERKMSGTYYLSTPPVVKNVITADKDMCHGEELCIQLDGSDAGVRYVIMDGHGNRVTEASGDPAQVPFTVGCIKETGKYIVKAIVASCSEDMRGDTVRTHVSELPYLSVESDYHFCSGSEGEQIAVFAPTNPDITYSLYSPSPQESRLEDLPGDAMGGEILFKKVNGSGYYKVKAHDPITGCTAVDSVRMIPDNRPNSYELTSSNGSYICSGESVSVSLSGSETGTSYALYKVGIEDPVAGPMNGTGKALTFSKKITVAGTYYVTAMYESGLQCKIDFGALTLEQAPALDKFRLESMTNSYCAGDAAKGSLSLAGSQNGIKYMLERDGVLTGDDKTGTGGILTWTLLDGKPCGDMTNKQDGYKYRIVALDETTACSVRMLGGDTIVEVVPLNLIAQEPSEDRLIKCEGTKVQFSLTTVGCRENYQWFFNGGKIPGETKNYYNIEQLEMANVGEYYCEVTNACPKKVSSIPVSLEVRELVKIGKPMDDIAICDEREHNVMFASGFRNANFYKWYRSDDPDKNMLSDSAFLDMRNAGKDKMGVYICAANNSCNVEVRDTGILTYGVFPDIAIGDVRVDTVCAGTIYDKLEVKPALGINPQWYLGDKPIGFTGTRLRLLNTTPQDEGPYIVHAANGCGETVLHVGTLYVDQKMKVESASDPTMIRCLGSTEHLYVNVTPPERVKYVWEYTDGTRFDGSDRITVGPFKESTDQVYWVRFTNKCGVAAGEVNYREFVVHVPRPISIPVNLPREIVTCADCATDTVVRLHMDKAIYANYKWWYRKNRTSDVRILLPSDADTLAITKCSSNTGFYYCDISNDCEAKTTETMWVRVDSVPVVKGHLADDTVCEGTRKTLTLASTGGGLTYEWHILKKGADKAEVLKPEAMKEDFESVGELKLTAGAEYDSCLIWCHVYNTCGEKNSDTMVLRVDKKRQILIAPTDTTVCAGSFAEIRVKILNAKIPWNYQYRLGNDEQSQVNRIVYHAEDTLQLDQTGQYTVSFVSDGSRCNYAEGNTQFKIHNYYIPEASLELLSKDTLCPGEKGQIQIKIKYPVRPAGTALPEGPWEVVFVNENGSVVNEDMNLMNPLYVYRQNAVDEEIIYTIPAFTVRTTATYYIGSVKEAGGLTPPCMGETKDSVHFVVLPKDTLRFDFRSERDSIGFCEEVKLDTLLRPNMPGKFYVDGIYSQLGIFKVPIYAPGKHVVTYVTESSKCQGTKENINLWIMPKPRLEVTPRDASLCPGTDGEIVLNPIGCAPFKLEYDVRNESRDPLNPPLTTPFSKITSGPVTIKVAYGNMMDSLRVVIPRLLTDKYGCLADKVDTIQGRMHLREWPMSELMGRYKDYEGGDWCNRDPFIIPIGDSVEFKLELKSGGKPWQFDLIRPGLTTRLGPVYGKDTIYVGKWEGDYKFHIVDGYGCTRPLDTQKKTIFFRQEGYVRIKTLLEGPYIDNSSPVRMGAALQRLNVLPKEGLAAWPTNGQDSVVDWIMAELREEMDQEAVALDTFLLRNDGQLITRSGNDTLTFSNTDRLLDADNYYIVLTHRNHVGVISSAKIHIVSKEYKKDVRSFDVTREGAVHCPSGSTPERHMTKLKTGVWAMSAGYPLTNDGLISISNPNMTKFAPARETDASYPGYYWRDVNFDGTVQWPDDIPPGDYIFDSNHTSQFKKRDAWIVHHNRDKYSAVPVPKPGK